MYQVKHGNNHEKLRRFLNIIIYCKLKYFTTYLKSLLPKTKPIYKIIFFYLNYCFFKKRHFIYGIAF